MFWPFQRKRRTPDRLDRYAESLIEQGVDPLHVERAVGMLRRIISDGGLPEYRYLLEPADQPEPEGKRPLDLLQIAPSPPAERRDEEQ